MKKWIFAVLSLLIIFPAIAEDIQTPPPPPPGGGSRAEICGSLQTYERVKSTCISYGYSYPTIQLRYFTNDGNNVVWRIKQAKVSDQVTDYWVIEGSIGCQGCTESLSDAEVERIGQEAAEAMAYNEHNLETRPWYTGRGTSNVSNSANWAPALLNSVFGGVAGSVSGELTKQMLANEKNKSTNDRAPIEVIYMKDSGMPIGASRHTPDGNEVVLMLKDRTGEDGRAELYWSGRVDYETAVDIGFAFKDYRWGTGREYGCRVLFTGSTDHMVPQVVCY
ncbi:hypothetical protein [Thalassomonas actiniarum]|uniref:Uncharacterized protein n=1 Tax=Thalassomonas actiniarum TaxID=485447 RepID=A0AAE9YYR6_9GAMM|nr:hypothetical protein [Thalassomonas actiniarum]WDE02102.1 hypothetical protein SG35_030530 [Thalassomonas actiniarum]